MAEEYRSDAELDLATIAGVVVALMRYSSVTSAMWAIMWTDPTGNLPTDVSPLSITASVPSKMALATSLTSARVGEACSIMLCSICVATITGLPAVWQRRIRSFWMIGTCATSISTPRSPRATISPSRGIDDRVDLVDRLGLFDFGDQVNVGDFVAQVLAQKLQIFGRCGRTRGPGNPDHFRSPNRRIPNRVR